MSPASPLSVGGVVGEASGSPESLGSLAVSRFCGGEGMSVSTISQSVVDSDALSLSVPILERS